MIINISKINLSGCSGGGGGDSKVISTKNFEVTANGTTNIVMDQGVDGISAGTITTNVDMGPAYSSGYTEGYASGETVGAAAQKALLTSTTVTTNGTVTRENGYSAVTVSVQPTLTAATFDQNGTYTPGSGVDGFNSVTVNVDGAENRLNKFFKDQVTAVTQSDLDGVITTSNYQFYFHTNLKSVDLPASVKTLSSNCFAYSGIESIDISNVTQMNDSVFSNCSSLTGVTGLENYTREATNYLFRDCINLTGDLVTGMKGSQYGGNSLFQNCAKLTSVTFLSNITDFCGSSAYNNWFAGCSKIEYLDFTHNYTIPNLRIANPFTAFTQNYEIRVPQVLYDQWTAATNWSDSRVVNHIVGCPNAYNVMSLKYTTSDGNDITPVIAYTSTTWGSSVVGSEFDATTGGTVNFYGPSLTIPSYTFSGKTTLESMTLDSAVTRLDIATFYGCTGLTGVTMPSVTEISQDAFKNCSSLTNDTLDFTKYTIIGNSAFTNCVSLTGATLPSACTVNKYAFDGCTALTSISLPSTGTVGSNAFMNCGLVGTLTVPNVNVFEGSAPFSGCTGLTDVVFEGSFNAYNQGVGDIFKYGPTITGATFNSGVSFQYGSNPDYSHIVSMTFKSPTPPTGNVGQFSSTGTMYVPAEYLSVYTNWASNQTKFSGWTVTAIS